MTGTRKPRRKATTDLGRSVLQKERQRLAREQALLAEQLAEDAARRRKAMNQQTKESKEDIAERAMQRSVMRRIAGVLATEGVNVPITTNVLRPTQNISAWTDFRQIVVEYHLYDDIKLTAAVLRGLMYHEGGHCRFTIPFQDLESDAFDAFLAAYPDPTGITEDKKNVIMRKGFDRIALHAAWNALEDQRMETAVVSDSPRKAAYLTPMMLSELADTPERAAANWPLMVGRTYLPKRIRDGSLAMFVAMYGEDMVRQIRSIVSRYVLGTDATTLYGCVIEMANVLRSTNLAFDINDYPMGHGRHSSRKYGEDSVKPSYDIPVSPQDEEEQPEEEQAEKDDSPKEAGTSSPPPSTKPPLDQGVLDEAIAEAEEQRMKDSALDRDVDSFYEAFQEGASKLPPYVAGRCTHEVEIREANALGDGLRRSFDQATVEISPSWQERQRRGVLNVRDYVMRQADDVEFFRNYEDDGQPGHDLAVSVLLDNSGSMSNTERALARVAYACKTACQSLNIPCTVVLWNTKALTLWDADEKVLDVPTIQTSGGTNPLAALADLDNHRQGKGQHIVLIMTDDDWGKGSPTLVAYKENRVIVGLGYNHGSDASLMAASLERKGADFAYGIDDLALIPKHLEQVLIRSAFLNR